MLVCKSCQNKISSLPKEHGSTDFLNNVPWTDETKVKMFGDNAQLQVCTDTLCLIFVKCLIPPVKHSGGGMSWGCFTAIGPGYPAVIELASTPLYTIKIQAFLVF